MTTSLRHLGECIEASGPFSVRSDLVPAAEQGRFPRIGLGQIGGPISALRIMRRVEWAFCGGADYLKTAVPRELRSPSREEAQVIVDGIVSKVKLFMGRSDWELDWHVYLDLDEQVKASLRTAGPLPAGGLYSELMGIDRWEGEIFGRQWWSSDMDGAFSLRWPLPDGHGDAETASEHWSWAANDDQGTNITVADANDQSRRGNSAIVGRRVYLQGPLVIDMPLDTDDHNLLEIHPLDSIAYARDGSGTTLSARPTDAGWPNTLVQWRVAATTNGKFHRIGSCDFLRQPRTTVWYLALPRAATLPGVSTFVTGRAPGLWHAPSNQRYTGRGVRSVSVEPPADGAALSPASFPIDPVDGRHKLRVSITMDEPDDWGGIFLHDYTIRSRAVAVPT